MVVCYSLADSKFLALTRKQIRHCLNFSVFHKGALPLGQIERPRSGKIQSKTNDLPAISSPDFME